MHALNNLVQNCPQAPTFFRATTFVAAPKGTPSTRFAINLNWICEQQRAAAPKGAARQDIKCTPRDGNYSRDVVEGALEAARLRWVHVWPTKSPRGAWDAMRARCTEQDDFFLGFILNTSDFAGHYIAVTGPQFNGSNPDALAVIDSVGGGGGGGGGGGLAAPRASADTIRNVVTVWAVYDDDEDRTEIE